MTEALALIGVLFIIFSIIVISVWLKGSEKESAEAFKGMVLAIWGLIAFCIGSWLISVVIWGGLEILESISNRLHIPLLLILFLPIFLLILLGLLIQFKKK